MAELDSDGLVVGSGPAGSAAALASATYGIRTTVITKYGRLADTRCAAAPAQSLAVTVRAHGVSGGRLCSAGHPADR